ncbi:MAG: VOC family protein [Actinomycetota bacterium]|nr:VOC family protein [Actinomycetota bacterium]
MPPRLAVTGLVVSDMPAALAFYRRLGLAIPAAADTEPHVQLAVADGIDLTLDTEDTMRSFDPGWTPPSSGQRSALGFTCDSPAEVDSTYADLTGAGYEGHLAPFDAFWGMRYATLHDPDGNAVDLYALLPT